jgi:hypothetical protein
VIQVWSIVDAQREYATVDRSAMASPRYGLSVSTPGNHDGLYWETEDGLPSPLAVAAAASTIAIRNQRPMPCSLPGYYYKMPTFDPIARWRFMIISSRAR